MIVFGVVIVLAFFAKDMILKATVTSAISQVAHVPVEIKSFKTSLLKGAAELKGIHIQNPSSYQDRTMLDMPELTVDFDPMALFSGKVHFEAVRIDLKELVVVKDKEGKLNIDALKGGQKEAASGKKNAEVKLRIDKLDLSIGTVVYKDYSRGGNPSIQTFPINIRNKEYRDITNPQALVALIMFEALTHTTLSKLTDLSFFKEGAGGVLNLAGDSANLIQGKAKDILGLFK